MTFRDEARQDRLLPVVITATRRDTRPDIECWLDRFEKKDGPCFYVIGDATGGDTQARKWCERNGKPHVVVRVDETIPSPARFRLRNERMVTVAVALGTAGNEGFCLAFPDDASRGTWHCVGVANRAGLNVHVLKLREGGEGNHV